MAVGRVAVGAGVMSAFAPALTLGLAVMFGAG